MTYAADFTNAGKNRSATLTLYTIANGRRAAGEMIGVQDKREARQIAKTRGYQAWNF